MSTGSTGAGWTWPFEIGQTVMFMEEDYITLPMKYGDRGRVVGITCNMSEGTFTIEVAWDGGYELAVPSLLLDSCLPTPPRFQTTDEADAWLEANRVHS